MDSTKLNAGISGTKSNRFFLVMDYHCDEGVAWIFEEENLVQSEVIRMKDEEQVEIKYFVLDHNGEAEKGSRWYCEWCVNMVSKIILGIFVSR